MNRDSNNGNHSFELLDQLPEAILIINQAGNIQFANQSACELTGISSNRLQNQQVTLPQDIFHPFEIDFRRNDMQSITTRVKLSEITWKNEKAYLSLLHDITREKKSLEALANSKEIFLQVTQNTNEAICICDENNEILFLNQFAEQLFKIDAEDFIGNDINAVFPEIGNAIETKLKLDTRDASPLRHQSITLTGSDGTSIEVDLSLKALDIGGRSLTLAIFRDLSEISHHKKQISQLDQSRHTLETQLEKLNATNLQQSEKIQRLENSQQLDHDQLEEYQQQIQKLQNLLENTKRISQQFSIQKEQLTEENRQQAILFAQTAKETTQLRQHLAQLESELGQTKHKLAESENSVRQNQDRLFTLQNDFAILQQELTSSQEKAEIQRQEFLLLNTKKTELAQQLETANHDLEQSLREISELSTEKNKLSEENNELTTHILTLGDKLLASHQKNEKLEEQLSDILIEREQLKDNLSSLLIEQENLQTENNTLQMRMDEINSVLQDTNTRLFTSESMEGFLRAMLESMTEEFILLNSEGEILWRSLTIEESDNGLLSSHVGNIRDLSKQFSASEITPAFWDEYLSGKPEPWALEFTDTRYPAREWSKMEIVPLEPNSTGKPLYFITIRDQSEQKALEKDNHLLRTCGQMALNLFLQIDEKYQQIIAEIKNTATHTGAGKAMTLLDKIDHDTFAFLQSFLDEALNLTGFPGGGIWLEDESSHTYHCASQINIHAPENITKFLEQQAETHPSSTSHTMFYDYSSLPELLDSTSVNDLEYRSLATLRSTRGIQADGASVLVLLYTRDNTIPLLYRQILSIIHEYFDNLFMNIQTLYRLKQTEGNFDSLLLAQERPQFILNTTGEIEFSNPAAHTTFAKSDAELSGKQLSHLLPADQSNSIPLVFEFNRVKPFDIQLLDEDMKPQPFRANPVKTHWNGEDAVFVEFTNIQEEISTRNSIQRLEMNLHFLRMTARRLFGDTDWRQKIRQIFKELAPLLRATRIYLGQLNKNLSTQSHIFNIIQEWNGKEPENIVYQHPMHLPHLADEHLNELKNLFKENTVLHGNQSDFSPAIWNTFAFPATECINIIPLFLERELWGVIGLEIPATERENRSPAPDSLQIIADFIQVCLEKEQLDEKVKQYKQKIEEIIKESTAELNQMAEEFSIEIEKMHRENQSQMENITEKNNLLEVSTYPFFLVDENLVICQTNRNGRKFFEDSFQCEIRNGTPLSTGADSQALKFFLENIQNAQAGSHIIQQIFKVSRIESDDAEEHWFELCFHPNNPVFTPDKNTLITIQDISPYQQETEMLKRELSSLTEHIKEQAAELSAANSDLSKAAHTRDHFLRIASHELRTPLNSILNHTETLLEEIHGPITPRQQQTLKSILQRGIRLQEIIGDILDLTQINAGGLNLEFKPVDELDLCSTCIQAVKENIRGKNIQIEYHPPEQPVQFYADPKKMAQMLNHLLRNVIHFTPENGKIILDRIINNDNHSIVFNVHGIDNEISPENFLELCQPFNHLTDASQTTFSNNAIGLALTQRLTDLHGGSLTFSHEADTGSCFSIHIPYPLPVYQQFETEAEKYQALINHSPLDMTSKARNKILLVDDNTMRLSSYSESLRRNGFDIYLARSVEETLTLTLDITPHIIIIDTEISNQDSVLHLIHSIRQHQVQSCPIIALTSLDYPGKEALFITAGVTCYGHRPVNIDQLYEYFLSISLFEETNTEVAGDKKQDSYHR